ncbi:MAG TPA: radical SAM protein [Candidatus Omnitrophota bacterium]|nr:radical SAM protein [Candidatus Omnitrophota bacterium]HPT07198.1 radical SAM protein [Candidatus Omnitrophota bacterium]
MKHVYGPLKSRRLGYSLGLSLTPYKICNFDCLYCQLGKTVQTVSQRKEYVPVAEIADELSRWLAAHKKEAERLDFITFSGSGEPTLNSAFGNLIAQIKKITDIPVCVITNASLVFDPAVREALCQASVIVPSLDAATDDIFQRIDRPHPAVKLADVIQGLVELRKEFSGKIWLEVMFVRGVNDNLEHARALKEVINRIKPDKVQINTPVRATSEPDVRAPETKRLQEIREILGPNTEVF